jgi:HD superfamily phosphodiesterase
MNAPTPSILDLASEHVTTLFRDRLDDRYRYHNLVHTTEVVEAAREIGEASGLDTDTLEVVLLAAWFHDAGIVRKYSPHEIEGAEIAAEFLLRHDFDPARIDSVRRCILATDIHVVPATLAERVISDADLKHIGTKRFWERSEDLRAEWEALLGEKTSDREWLQKQIAFVTGRSFHTSYARETYQEGLERNGKKLRKKLRQLEADDDRVEGGEEKDSEGKEGKNDTRGKKDKKSDKSAGAMLGRGDRGVETMFRITSRNHVEFSNMVDGKANIMISINTLVISVVISVLFRKLDSNTFMTIPTFVFLAVCLLTIIFSVLASRPKVTSGVFTREDITSKRANLLFFGNFYRVPVEEFEWGMREMLKDKDYLYDSMIRDFYYLGQVLGKKYYYLRISYTIFMYGFVFSILLYVIMFLSFAEAPMEILPFGW